MFKDWMAHHTLLLIAVLVAGGWLFAHEWRGKASDQQSMQDFIAQKQKDFDKKDAENKTAQDNLQKQLAAIAAQKQQVIQVPSSAPTIIRETIPMQQPFQPTAPITKDTKPRDVVGQLTLQQTQDLATFGLSCKECTSKLATLQVQDANKDKQISDLQGSLKTAEETARGGSPFKKTLRVIGVVACGAGGAWLGSKSGGGAKGSAIGAAVGTTGCALKFHF